jgi:hypothetical protein
MLVLVPAYDLVCAVARPRGRALQAAILTATSASSRLFWEPTASHGFRWA